MFKITAIMNRPNSDHDFYFIAMGDFREELYQAFFNAEGFINMTVDVEEELYMEASMNFETAEHAIKFSSIEKNKQLLEKRLELIKLHNSATGHTYDQRFREV